MNMQNDMSTHNALRSARRANWMAGIALFLVLLGFGLAYAGLWINGETQRIYRLLIRQNEVGDLTLWGKGMPYVVTHLETSDDKIAAINPPLAVTYNEYYRRQIIRLDWRDEKGKKVQPPAPNEKLSALYFRPERAQQKSSD
jgi:hypothetical protein